MHSEYPALVLNADFKVMSALPLSVMDWQDAVHNVVADDVVVVEEHPVEIHSPSMTMRLPSVIALRSYVKPRTIPSLSRYNLLALRDKGCCAYCGRRFPAAILTIDHVIPRAQGGRTRWENVVACCASCNQTKRDRTPSQAGMPLQWRPYLPSMEELAKADYSLHRRHIHEGWKAFLPFIE